MMVVKGVGIVVDVLLVVAVGFVGVGRYIVVLVDGRVG